MKDKIQKSPISKKPSWTEKIIPDNFPPKCQHHFELVPGGAKCERCGVGLLGVYEVKDGKPIF